MISFLKVAVVAILTLSGCNAISPLQDENDAVALAEISNNNNNNHHLRRRLQFNNGNTCGVTGFEVYNTYTLKWEPLASVVINGLPQAQLILTKFHPEGKINIQTKVNLAGCAVPTTIRYAKLNLGNSSVVARFSPPYNLYSSLQKPYKLGVTNFDVELTDGKLQFLCDDKLLLHIFMRENEILIPRSYKVKYYGLSTMATTTQALTFGQATCTFLKDAIKAKYIIPGSSLAFDEIGWKCITTATPSPFPNTSPDITYAFTAVFTISPMISVYANSIPPTKSVLDAYILALLQGNDVSAATNETLSTYLKKPATNLASNPYWWYTSIGAGLVL